MKRIYWIADKFLLSSLVLAGIAFTVEAQTPDQKTFSSSKEALSAFIDAVEKGSAAELNAILGPGNEQIVTSGDPVADKNVRNSFLNLYKQGHLLVPARNGALMLEVGKEKWPLPIPLAHSGDKWYWDGAAGKEEVLYRRIGHNELAAIDVCRGIVSAQHDYAMSGHDGQPAGVYAGRIVSEPGKQNGLYWEVKAGEKASPAGPMLAQAAQEGYAVSGKAIPYHGYYYRMLPSSHGFGVVAYPADYRSSGVMTFLVNESGVIYEKDLGDQTREISKQLSSYSTDKTWIPVK
jgi:hypothetical protein